MASERVVLDASAALEAMLPSSEASRAAAVELLERIGSGDIDARVPWVFFAEVAYVVTKKRRAKVLSKEEAEDFLLQIDGLGLQVDLTLEGASQLHATAMQWNASVYDALYVDAAQRMAIPVATRDRGMVTACRAAGVEVFAF